MDDLVHGGFLLVIFLHLDQFNQGLDGDTLYVGDTQ